ncbi:MAG TPA: isoprenylcysteine carboxylmethyltransferase family protein [Terriglobales bacterium]|nr:isoprenylcysteine carboxylmethyltransferase family protein [Terriglobales bacterium]
MTEAALPVWVQAVYVSWAVVGAYFIIAALAARRIKIREARSKRTLDILLIWGGYALLFAYISPSASIWNAAFVPPEFAAPIGFAGAAIAVAGLAMALGSRIVLGRWWSGTVALKADHQLVRTGPYRVVRHPLYTGLMAATLGAALAFGFWRSLAGAALLWIAFLWRARREDTLLAGQFGPQFLDYRRSTGRLLPRRNNAPLFSGSALYAAGVFGLGVILLFSNRFGGPVPTWPELTLALALASGLAMVVASASLFAHGAERWAANVLLWNFLGWCLLLRLPAIIADPLTLGSWANLGEPLVLLVAAWLLLRPIAPRPRVIPRVLFGVFVILTGAEHFAYATYTVGLVPGWLPAPMIWTYATGVCHIAAGIAIATGVYGQLAARLWALMITIFTVLVWVPRVWATPAQRPMWTELLMSAAMAGAGWVLAASYRASAEAARELRTHA